jgi:hypothetical protein
LKCRCPKWPRMSHLDICSPSYGQKKGWKSNWQFHSQPLKVGNPPESDVYRWNATWRWKALKESYKIASNLISIRRLSKTLWMPKIPGMQTGTISRFHFGSPEKKCHSDIALRRAGENTIWGKVVVSPKSGPWRDKWVQVTRGLSQHQGCFRMWINQLVVGFGWKAV